MSPRPCRTCIALSDQIALYLSLVVLYPAVVRHSCRPETRCPDKARDDATQTAHMHAAPFPGEARYDRAASALADHVPFRRGLSVSRFLTYARVVQDLRPANISGPVSGFAGYTRHARLAAHHMVLRMPLYSHVERYRAYRISTTAHTYKTFPPGDKHTSGSRSNASTRSRQLPAH